MRQDWETDDAEKAVKLLLNLARRVEVESPEVLRSISDGLDDFLIAIRLGLPPELRRSLAYQHQRASERRDQAAIRRVGAKLSTVIALDIGAPRRDEPCFMD